jgi:hypothetical protein
MRWLLPFLILSGALIVLIAEHRKRRNIEARIRAILSSSLTGLAILDRNGDAPVALDGPFGFTPGEDRDEDVPQGGARFTVILPTG